MADKLAAEDARPLGKHVKMAEVRIQRVLTAVGAKRLSELSPSAVQRAVGQMVGVEGMALKTANGYVQAIKQLSRWAWPTVTHCDMASSLASCRAAST